MPDYYHVPKLFPPSWASSYGEDEYGLWAGFDIDNIEQLFRWIEPAQFKMGSAKDEAKRNDNESLHEVHITQGYWLADSTVTQALWLVVMGGDNPSNFKNSLNNPVDSVSWKDTQQFIQALNKDLPKLNAHLPTEAQWENACRAGKSEVFSFGDNITTDQVNYNGDYPYANGEKGEYRKQTVAVKTLPANAWGLYEMHGNVWEWCEDWYGAYDNGLTINPTGAESGDRRVLRGGSWFYDGRVCRSARRYGDGPDGRGNDIGFRLALGLELQPAQPEQA